MQKCKDWKGRDVVDGQRYRPSKDDLCMECICNSGFRTQCSTALCALPPCHPYEAVPDSCCEFTCLSDENESGSNFRNSTVYLMHDQLSTAGVRLVASTLTCVMVLLLIVFFMHKLRRHRRFLMHAPQVFQPNRSAAFNDAAHGRAADQASSDYTVHYRQLLHDDPPPPYAPPKGQRPLAFSSDVAGYAPAYTAAPHQQRCSHCPHACGHCTRMMAAGASGLCQCRQGSVPVSGSTTARMPAGDSKPACPVLSSAAFECRPRFVPATLAAESDEALAEAFACTAQQQQQPPHFACFAAEHSQPACLTSTVQAPATALMEVAAAARDASAQFADRGHDSSAEVTPIVDDSVGLATVIPVASRDRLVSPAAAAGCTVDDANAPRYHSGSSSSGLLLLVINPKREVQPLSSESPSSSEQSPAVHPGPSEPASPDSNCDDHSVDADRRLLLRLDSRENGSA